MAAAAGALYLLSTVAFCAVALAVGGRLLLLWRRTRCAPELLLGLGLILTAGLGYGMMIAASIGRLAHGNEPHIAFIVGSGAGWLLHNVGVALVVGFVVHVFRPGVLWARMLAFLLVAVLWLGFAFYTLEGGLAHGRSEGFGFWVAFSAIGSYPLWGAAEALSYWRLMRRRRIVGLADPVVTNRFLLWGVASICTAAAVWSVTLPAVLGLPYERQVELLPLTLLATAVFGCGAVGAYWLGFFPPRWYRARLLGASAG